MTAEQEKILKYLSKRRTPAILKEVRLQTKIDKQTAYNSLRQLVKSGYITSKPVIVDFTKDSAYEFLTFEPTKKEPNRNPVRFSKARLTLDKKFYNDPFGLRT